MKLGELIPLPKVLKQKGSVPAGKAATVNFGVIGISMGIGHPDGETSKPSVRMPKYAPTSGKTQGTK